MGHVAQKACLDQFFGLPAVVELEGAHRVAADDPAHHHRARGAAAAGDRAVDPLVFGLALEFGSELLHGSRLAARGPPMGDFKVGS